jgi:hypothetical protein
MRMPGIEHQWDSDAVEEKMLDLLGESAEG